MAMLVKTSLSYWRQMSKMMVCTDEFKVDHSVPSPGHPWQAEELGEQGQVLGGSCKDRDRGAGRESPPCT